MDQLAITTENAMSALGGTDNVLIKQAEAYLKVFLNKKAAGATLVILLQHSSSTVVRQLSGVLLRPKIISLWNRLTLALREELKSVLLRRLAEEPSRGVRKAVISLIVALGKALLPGGNWPELGAAISLSSKPSNTEEVRELGMVLVKELTDSLATGVGVNPPLAEAFKITIGEALADATSKKVRAAALQALGSLLRAVGDSGSKKGLAGFTAVLPVMLKVTQQCLEDGQEDAVADALGTLNDLISVDSPVLSPHIEPLGRFLIAVLADTRLEDGTKDAAAASLVSLVECKPKTFVKKGLIDAAMPIILHLMSLYDYEEERDSILEGKRSGVEEADRVDPSIWNVAGRLLDAIALYCPAKVVWAKVSALAAPAMQDASNAMMRHAGLMLLSIVSEGCKDVMAPSLETLIRGCLSLANDPNLVVREAVLSCLCSFAEFINPRILGFHSIFVPGVAGMLTQEDNKREGWILQRGCQALECFLDGLDQDELKIYLPSLLALLGEQLVTAGQRVAAGGSEVELNLLVQEMTLAALSSVAFGSGKHILPYITGLFTALMPLIENTDPRAACMRGLALQAVAYTVGAAGKDDCRAYLPRIMATIGQNFAFASVGAFDSIELKQHTFVALETLFEAFGEEDMGAYVPELVKVTRQHIENTDYLEISEKEDHDHAAIAQAVSRLAGDDEEDDHAPAKHDSDDDGPGSDDEDDDDDDDYNNYQFKVHTSQVEMKAAALSCFGFMAQHCPKAFAPHLKDALTLVDNNVGTFHEKLRQRAILALPCLISSMLSISPPLPPSGPEEPAVMDSESRKAFDEVLHTLCMVLQREDDMSTVGSACIAIENICRDVGMAAVVTHHSLLMKELLKIGKGKARCQKVNDDGEGGRVHDSSDEEDEEEEDEDEDDDGSGRKSGAKKGAGAINASKAAAAIAKAAASAGMHGGHHTAHGGHHEEHHGGDDDEEHDHELIDAATDAILRVGQAMGSHFKIYLDDVVKTWLRYTGPSMTYLDHLMAVGLFADYAATLPNKIFEPYVDQILPAVLKGVTDADPEVRRNSMFCAGAFVQHCTDAVRPHINVIMHALYPSFAAGSRAACKENKAEHLAVDNAAAALCKAIIAIPEAVPLAMALPPLVNVLPLHGDWEEAKPVYLCLMRLLAAENAEILKLLPAVLKIAAAGLVPDSRVPLDVQQTIIALNLKAVANTGSPATKAALASALATLNEQERAVLMRAVS